MSKRVLEIQGLRAFAAILVVIFHARLVGGGFIGVDIFYVISGYLITGLIVREISKTGTLDFSQFYLRRIKRLLPTSSFVLILTAVASWLLLAPNTRTSIGRDVIAASIYICNYLFAWWENDYQNLGAIPSPLIHYWSLAVEEQFYLLWPAFLFILAKFGKRTAITIGIWASTIASFMYSIYLTHASPIWSFYSLPTRAWELGAGALLALSPNLKVKRPITSWIAVVVLLYATFEFNSSTAFPGFAALAPTLATVLLIASIGSWPPILADLAQSKISQWLGGISYPLYLWHWPLLVLPSAYYGRPLHFYERAICIVATVIAADLTHRFIEEPLRLRALATKTIVFGAVVITVLSIAIGFTISHSVSSKIAIEGQDKQYSLVKIVRKPAVYANGCHVNYGENSSPLCEFGDLKSKKKIVLYGDSHAAQWFPTLEKLANEEHFTLISLTKSACPSIEVTRTSRGAFSASECDLWRSNSVKRIHALHPDAVLVTGFQWYAPPKGSGSREQWWRTGQILTVEHLRGATDKLLFLSDTPHVNRDIPTCLASAKLHDCNNSEPSFNNIPSQELAIDPTAWLCKSTCNALMDDIVAYRDGSHISVDVALSLASKMKDALSRFNIL